MTTKALREPIPLILGKLFANRSKQGVGILLLQTQQKAHGAEIRANIEQVSGGYLPQHHTPVDSTGGEGADHSGQLAHFDPFERGDLALQRGIGLSLKTNGHDGFTATTGLSGKEERQGLASGNQANHGFSLRKTSRLGKSGLETWNTCAEQPTRGQSSLSPSDYSWVPGEKLPTSGGSLNARTSRNRPRAHLRLGEGLPELTETLGNGGLGRFLALHL
jgi:hypothetical protein